MTTILVLLSFSAGFAARHYAPRLKALIGRKFFGVGIE